MSLLFRTQEVRFTRQVYASVWKCRIVVRTPYANPFLGPLDNPELPKCAEEQRGLFVAPAMTLPDRIPRCATPVTRIAVERVHFATFDRRVHDRSPLAARITNESIKHPLDFDVNGLPLTLRELAPLLVKSNPEVDVCQLPNATTFINIC